VSITPCRHVVGERSISIRNDKVTARASREWEI